MHRRNGHHRKSRGSVAERLCDDAIAESERGRTAVTFADLEARASLVADVENIALAFRREEDDVRYRWVHRVRKRRIDLHVSGPVGQLRFSEVLDGWQRLFRRIELD